MESTLLNRTARLMSKDDGERANTLYMLCETLDRSDPQANKTMGQAVLDYKAVMDVLLSLSATTRSAGVVENALWVLVPLAKDLDNARRLFQEQPSLVLVVVRKLEPGAVNATEDVQEVAFDVLRALARNADNARDMVTKHSTFASVLVAKIGSELGHLALYLLEDLARYNENAREVAIEYFVANVRSNLEQTQIRALGSLSMLAYKLGNARDMATSFPTLVPLLVAKVEAKSEQVQVAALGALQQFAYNLDNARDMATSFPTLVPLLVAKVEAKSEQVQTAALGALQALAANVDNAQEMLANYAKLVPLLVAKVESKSEKVQVGAWHVLQDLSINVDNAREMFTKDPTLIFLLVTKVRSKLEQVQKEAWQVQVGALGVLSNLAANVDDVREMVTKNPAFVPLLVAKMDSNSGTLHFAALGMLQSLAWDDESAWAMTIELTTLVSRVVAKVKSPWKDVQVAALRVLQKLAVNPNNARKMATEHAFLVPLVLAELKSESEQVQVEALIVLQGLAYDDDNAREMITKNPTIVSLLVAKVESNLELVQVKALGVLHNLARNWNSGTKQKMETLLVSRLGTDDPEQVQVALSVLQSMAGKNENAREMVVKHAKLVPLLMTTLAFAALPATTSAAPFMFPVFPQALTDASAELDVVLKFRLLVDKVKVSTKRLLDKDAFMDQNCGDGSVLECFQDLESMKLDLTQLEAQLGSEPFFALPTPQQQDWIAKRSLARSNLLYSAKSLKQAIFATGAAHLAELNALMRLLGGAIDELDFFVQCNDNLFSADSVCLEAFKSSVIEMKQRELLHVFQVELVQGISNTFPCYAIDRMTNCYLELILLCKMRTREELDAMLQQARDVLQSPGVLSWTEKRLESSNELISQNEELYAKLERANQIIAETVQLKDRFTDLEIAIDEHNALRKRALKRGQDVAAIEGEMATLDATSKSIISKRNKLDKEMRHLVSKPMASEENVVCHFPELFHRVTLEWEAKPVGQALSKADEVKALLLKSDLLMSQGVDEYAGPTERMQLTMENVQSVAVKGAVAHGSGAQVVIKKVKIKDSLTEITKMKRILRASRIAAHPSILSCLGGIVVSEQEVNLVFPYMSGGDLAFWSQERVRPVSRKLDVLTQVSDAIVALHRIDIFHRDIKPWNIVMDSPQDDALPKLTDFEMSKEMGVAQTFNTTRGLLGTTQGFRAPEVGKRVSFSATHYEKQDVYSFGATAMWLLGDDPAHAALVTSCTNDDAYSRPTSKDVYEQLSKRRCIVCLEDDVAFKDCVVCPDGAHCICNGCFDGWVKDQLQTELGRRKEIVACPSCTTNAPFPTRLYAHHIDLVLRSHREKVEVAVRKQVADEEAAALERERELGVVALALRKIEDLLISKCPQCKAAFVDFTNCCALTCARCKIQFCAFCHQGASADAHSHVLRCVENPEEGRLFCDEAVYAAQQKAFKTKLLKAFLETLDGVTRDRVRESAVVREYFQ